MSPPRDGFCAYGPSWPKVTFAPSRPAFCRPPVPKPDEGEPTIRGGSLGSGGRAGLPWHQTATGAASGPRAFHGVTCPWEASVFRRASSASAEQSLRSPVQRLAVRFSHGSRPPDGDCGPGNRGAGKCFFGRPLPRRSSQGAAGGPPGTSVSATAGMTFRPAPRDVAPAKVLAVIGWHRMWEAL